VSGGNVFAADSATPGSLVAALNACNAAGGGTVQLSPGLFTYNSTSPLITGSAVQFSGAGPSLTQLVLYGGNLGCISLANAYSSVSDLTIVRGNSVVNSLIVTDANNCQIRNVVMDGAGLSYSGGGLSANPGSDGLRITGCTLLNTNGIGLSINRVNGIRITDNNFQGSIGSSPIVSLNTNVTRFVITGNVFSSNPTLATGGAINVLTLASGNYADYGVISGNTFEMVAFAVTVQQQLGNVPGILTISNNVMRALVGVFGGVSLSNAASVAVVGNTIDMGGFTSSTCIEVNTSSYCTVAGNTMLGAGVSTPINLNGACFNTVSGNMVNGFRDGVGTVGIGVFAGSSTGEASATDNVITGNSVIFPVAAAGNLQYGIGLSCNYSGGFVDRNVIVGNSVVGNGVVNSRGIGLNGNSSGGSLTNNLVGMNVVTNCATPLYQNGDTSTLLSGSTWNVT
jgi:hypothetical protein